MSQRGAIYYFQRQDSNDPEADLPASGATTGIARNRMLMEYLRHLTGRNIPGFGGNFATKYSDGDSIPGSGINGTERDQILTEIFDYIRSTNTLDKSLAVGTTNPVTTYTSNTTSGKGAVVPAVDSKTGTRGFGRFPTLQQAALIVYASDSAYLPVMTASGGTLVPVGTSKVQPVQMKATFVLQLFDPSMGYPWNVGTYQVKISGLDQFTWDAGAGGGALQMFPNAGGGGVTLNSGNTVTLNPEPLTGGVMGWRRLFFGNCTLNKKSVYNDEDPNAAIWSPGYPKSPGATALTDLNGKSVNSTFAFNGGPITVEFYQNLNGTTGKLLQRITFNFPGHSALPLPKLPIVDPSKNGIKYHVAPEYIAGTKSSRNWELWFTGLYGRVPGTKPNYDRSWISNGDVIQSVIAAPGDVRLIAARTEIGQASSSKFLAQHPRFGQKMAHALRTANDDEFYGGSYTSGGSGKLVSTATYDQAQTGIFGGNAGSFNKGANESGLGGQNSAPKDSDVTSDGVTVGGVSGGAPGDWDNGIGNLRDGSYINKADEGDLNTSNSSYFYVFRSTQPDSTFFSPNRMIPSAGMFGSLPSGVLGNKPWQTLLFRPGPEGHPGLGFYNNKPAPAPPYDKPPDSLLLDLFTMPVVEPYPISEPLSTAGRINMNYQIAPFTYITRRTGLLAALKSVMVPSVPFKDAAIYKVSQHTTSNPSAIPPNPGKYRLSLNYDATTRQFDDRFSRNDLFRAPAEICSIDLVPSDYSGVIPVTRASMDSYWGTNNEPTGHQLTGDNSRERPYANLYPLLTTKSNTYTIHFRVQALKQVPKNDWATWDESRDVVLGEYRGSQTIERYVDTSDSNIPDYADLDPANPPLDTFYKFRVIETKRFAP